MGFLVKFQCAQPWIALSTDVTVVDFLTPDRRMNSTMEINQKEEVIVAYSYIVGHRKLATYEQQQCEPLGLHWTCIHFHTPHKGNSLRVFGRVVPTALPWLKPEHQKCVFVTSKRP